MSERGNDHPSRPPGAAGMNGVLVGGITAVISGISVFANSYGVHHVPSPVGVHHGEEPGCLSWSWLPARWWPIDLEAETLDAEG